MRRRRGRAPEPVFLRLEDYLFDRYMRNKLRRLPPIVAANLDRAKYYGMLGPQMMADWPLLNMRWLDAVADYGADPTFGTDSTTALNNWLAAAPQTTLVSSIMSHSKLLFLPTGQYKITDNLLLPDYPGIRIQGAGKMQSIIEQQTAGKCVLLRRESTAGSAHTFICMGVGMGYPTSQTNTGSQAVKYTASLGSGTGLFDDKWEDVYVYNAYEAWGYEATGAISTWSSVWRDIVCSIIKHSAMNVVAGSTVGQPSFLLENWLVNNAGASNPVSTGPMFYLEAVNECMMIKMDLEGWYNEICISDSSNVKIQGLHLENNFLSNGFARMFLPSNGTLMLDNWTLGNTSTTAGCTDAAVMLWLNVGSQAELRNGQHNVDLSLGTHYINELIYGNMQNNADAFVWNVRKTGGGFNEYAGNLNTNTLVATTGLALPIKDSVVIPRRFFRPSGTGTRLQSGSIFRIL